MAMTYMPFHSFGNHAGGESSSGKTGIRASGFLTAIGSAFCIKAGSGIGGFIPAIVMEFFGYVPNAVQSAQAVFGIQLVFT